MTDEKPPAEAPTEAAAPTDPAKPAEAAAEFADGAATDAAQAPDAGTSHDPPPEVSPLEAAEARAATLEKEKKDTYERLLRSAADFENYKKRMRRELDDTLLKAREQVLREMLPVVDNLERALGAATAGEVTAGSVVDGVRLVLRQFGSALEKFEVKAVEAIGVPFDPTVHEAISQVESAEHPAGTVVSEMQRGYMLGPRLLRPAMVAVSRRPPEAQAEAVVADSSSAGEPVEVEVEVVAEASPPPEPGKGGDGGGAT